MRGDIDVRFQLRLHVEFKCSLRDVVGQIAHPFQLGRDLHRRRDEPEIARSRLLQRQQANAHVIDVHIESIDVPIVLNDPLRQVRIPIHQRLHGTLDLLFNDRPHAQELLFQLCEFLIEVALHGPDVLPVTRNGR